MDPPTSFSSEEKPPPLPRSGPSFPVEQSSVDTHKSSFAGTRQPSEDSKNIRFVEHQTVEDDPNKRRRSRRAKGNWQNVARRLSMHPELAKLTSGGLTKIRVRGHLNRKEMIQRFERQSTFHGICHAALAPTTRWRWFWYTAFWICLIALLTQVFFLIVKFQQYTKTVDLDLKFENAPFPAITLCNLNPYKKSAVNKNPATKAMMDAYSKRISIDGDKTEGIAAALASHLHSQVRREKRKTRRRSNDRRYHQAFAQCLCDVDPLTADRKGSCFAAQKGTVAVQLNGTSGILGNFHPSRCLCQFDQVSRTLWPCFPYSSWKEKLCSECVDGSGHCPMRFYKGDEAYEKIKDQVDICLCHKEYNHCVSTRDDGVILEIDPSDELATLNVTERSENQLSKLRTATTTTTTPEPPELEETLGFENITDEIALTTQAQQNLMFAVGSMTSLEKQQMSHSLDGFILKCSFNQKDCDLQRDFKLYYDNTFGNCYTFNHDRTSERSSQRAGANYGLRIMLYADVSEYLPTSEAVGFRITVHDIHNVPFPDAFGYSAPTGFQSSFGVRMKQFIRLTQPWGHCQEGGEDEPFYVYKGFSYSVEGCHRSCAQKLIVERCGCGDPMFPMANTTIAKPCEATNTKQRECLRNTTLYIGEMASKGKDSIPGCFCHQPCQETNYEVTYSAARWPSGSAKVMDCTPGDYMCLEKYRKNSAMIQVFYEELNYETLQETPAYTFTSLMADVGGLTGLWIGASVVSLLEVFALGVFAAQAWVRQRKGSVSSSSNPQLSLSHKQSKTSLHTLHKTSTNTKLSIQDIRSLKSNHSSKSRSKQSIFLEDLPEPIQEQSDIDEESSSGSTNNTSSSCRYLPPGEDLPCLCKYDANGLITVMKALCPVHGYMVRRQYDYSVSNSEADEEDVDEVHREEPYFPEPYMSSKRIGSTKSRTKSGTRDEDKEAAEGLRSNEVNEENQRGQEENEEEPGPS